MHIMTDYSGIAKMGRVAPTSSAGFSVDYVCLCVCSHCLFVYTCLFSACPRGCLPACLSSPPFCFPRSPPPSLSHSPSLSLTLLLLHLCLSPSLLLPPFSGSLQRPSPSLLFLSFLCKTLSPVSVSAPISGRLHFSLLCREVSYSAYLSLVLLLQSGPTVRVPKQSLLRRCSNFSLNSPSLFLLQNPPTVLELKRRLIQS